MELPIACADAAKRYPKHFGEVMKQIRSSKNKLRENAPDTFQWGLSWAVKVESDSHADILNGKARKRAQELEARREDKAVDDYFKNALINLRATVGRTTYASLTMITDRPPEIEQMVRRDWKERRAELTRLASMSPEELRQETQRLLDELTAGGNFVRIVHPGNTHGR